jgi:glyoxylase-like metal-dependent hydrolase (beta-lactamase superfamily II)
VHVQAPEAFGTKRVTGCSDSDLALHDSGDVIEVGDLRITLVHTPGHTPGSQCFHVDGMLVSGDTLFLDGCGRTDLPGGDPEALYESLTTKLATIPDDTVLFPGHLYSPEPSARLGEVRRRNYVFRPRTRDQWMMMFGHDGF